MASFEYRDGKMIEVPDIVVTESRQIDQDVGRTLVIESGAMVTTNGRVSGTINVKRGATLDARGTSGGPCTLRPAAEPHPTHRWAGPCTSSLAERPRLGQQQSR